MSEIMYVIARHSGQDVEAALKLFGNLREFPQIQGY